MASNQTTLPNVSENEETLLTGVNENVYEDQSIGAELTKKDINRVAWRSMLLQASFNYERMQASGWLYGLLPALKKIHTNKRDLARAMKGHMGFFNTHPFLVTFVIGIILAMERSKQDVNSIQSTKIAVGAPLGGIGDAMFWLTLLPICGGIAQASRYKALFLALSSLLCCSTWCTWGCVLVWRIMLTAWAWRLFHSLKQIPKKSAMRRLSLG
ncbi:PTS system, N-acetylgalactosamine-specific IID component [Escherichia coli IS35]|nr:PTS system, N-acetylgalactosamine-specific IID component [Escherichia coli IS35]